MELIDAASLPTQQERIHAMTHMVADLLGELARARFFGSLELKFEAGQVVLLRKTETIKPKIEPRRDTRGADDVSSTS